MPFPHFSPKPALLPPHAHPSLTLRTQYLSSPPPLPIPPPSPTPTPTPLPKSVYIVQPLCQSADGTVNDSLVELLLMVSTFRRSSAKTITAVIPYYAYGRQSCKSENRTPVASADVARMLEAVGVDRIVAIDLHRGQIQGFFGPRVPVDNLEAIPMAASYFNDKELVAPVIVSPGDDAVYRAKQFQEVMIQQGKYPDASMALCIEKLDSSGIEFVGDVDGKDCIIVGGTIDSGGHMIKTADQLILHVRAREQAVLLVVAV